jgi:signal transduction histidine kinase
VNVIRNAYQAMAERPRATGERHQLTLGAREETGDDGVRGVTIVVADTGPGVTEDLIDRMFNPFFTTRAAGTGLGLAIVHRIVDAHGGRVAVRNGRDGGAVFELFFPFTGMSGAGDGPCTDRAGVLTQETGR